MLENARVTSSSAGWLHSGGSTPNHAPIDYMAELARIFKHRHVGEAERWTSMAGAGSHSYYYCLCEDDGNHAERDAEDDEGAKSIS